MDTIDAKGKRMPHKKTSKGFTLVELIVVIAILAVLAMILIPNITGYIAKAQESVCLSNRGTLKRIYSGYTILEHKSVEDNTVGVGFLADEGYLNEAQAQSDALNRMIWRVYENGAVDVFCAEGEAEVATYLFHSPFDTMDHIKVLTGSWEVVDGVLKPTKNGENRAIFEGTSGTDYTVEMNAVYLSGAKGQSGYGIYYRASEASAISGYAFQYDPGAGNAFVVREVNNGKESATIQRVTMSSTMGKDFDITEPHDIKIEVVGDKHVISVDGKKVLEFVDDTFKSGSVGVRTWNDSKVLFDEVTVTKK